MDLSKVVEGVVADEDEDVVEEAPGESGPRSIGVFRGLTARELNGKERSRSSTVLLVATTTTTETKVTSLKQVEASLHLIALHG